MQSLAEQKHALKISEDTLMIMCKHKRATIDIKKPTFPFRAGKFWGRRQNLTWSPSWFLRFKKWQNPAFWKFGNSYIYVYFTVILYFGPFFNWGPRENCPLHASVWTPLTAPAVMTISDSISFHIYMLAVKKCFRPGQWNTDKAWQSSRGVPGACSNRRLYNLGSLKGNFLQCTGTLYLILNIIH